MPTLLGKQVFFNPLIRTMTAILTGAAIGQINKTAQWYTLGGISQGDATTMTEGYPGTYSASPPANMADSDEPYLLVIRSGSVLEGYTLYYWDGENEIDISLIYDRLLAIDLSGLTTSAVDTTAILSAIASKPVTPVTDLSALFAAITAVKSEIIARGDAAWTTGIGGDGGGSTSSGDMTPVINAITALETALASQLASIAADAVIARKGVTNDAEVDKTANTATIFEDDRITPLAMFDLIPTAQNPLVRRRIN